MCNLVQCLALAQHLTWQHRIQTWVLLVESPELFVRSVLQIWYTCRFNIDDSIASFNLASEKTGEHNNQFI